MSPSYSCRGCCGTPSAASASRHWSCSGGRPWPSGPPSISRSGSPIELGQAPPLDRSTPRDRGRADGIVLFTRSRSTLGTARRPSSGEAAAESRRPRGDEPAGGPACRAFREESARASAASQPRALLVKVDADDAHRPRRVPRVARDVLAAERPVQVVVLDDVAALRALAPRPAAALFADFGLSQAVSSGRHEWYHRRARRGPARTASSRTETRTSCSSVLGDAGQRRHRMIIGQRRRRLHGPANKQRAYRFALVSSPPRRSGRAASRAITQVRPRLGPETSRPRAALLQRGAAGR
jgi:hypothetical protein